MPSTQIPSQIPSPTQKPLKDPVKRKSGAENTETQAFRALWNATLKHKSLNLAGELWYARDFVPLFALLPSLLCGLDDDATAIPDPDSVPMNNWTDQLIDRRDRDFTISLALSL